MVKDTIPAMGNVILHKKKMFLIEDFPYSLMEEFIKYNISFSHKISLTNNPMAWNMVQAKCEICLTNTEK